MQSNSLRPCFSFAWFHQTLSNRKWCLWCCCRWCTYTRAWFSLQTSGIFEQNPYFSSKKLLEYDRELLAIVTCCKKWRQYIDGQRTVVITDHRPLVHLSTQPILNKRQIRWITALADTPIIIKWWPGDAAVVLDSLSRSHQTDKLKYETQYLLQSLSSLQALFALCLWKNPSCVELLKSSLTTPIQKWPNFWPWHTPMILHFVL